MVVDRIFIHILSTFLNIGSQLYSQYVKKFFSQFTSYPHISLSYKSEFLPINPWIPTDTNSVPLKELCTLSNSIPYPLVEQEITDVFNLDVG